MPEMVFRYFSPVAGRVVPRYGTQSFIGAARSPHGFVINPDAVVAIPEVEVLKFLKEYRNALQRGELKKRTEEDYNAYNVARAAKSKQAADALKKQRDAESPAADSGKTDAKPASQ